MRRRLISGDEAIAVSRPLSAPCSDCPFARDSIAGWLGNLSPREWIQAVHGEVKIDCHAVLSQECYGAAIYRRNVGKICRNPAILKVDAPDKVKVFASPKEFVDHHQRSGLK